MTLGETLALATGHAATRKASYPVGVLWCANSRGLGWTFPAAVKRQLKVDTAGLSVLHLFGGRADFGTRLDIDPVVVPDVIGDAWIPPFGRESFDVVILDPPYLRLCGEELSSLMRTAAWVARKRVVWFHTIWVSSRHGLKPERAWLVRVGDSCQARVLQYFRVTRRVSAPTHFKRGPAIKYNRWLAQPAALPLLEAGGD